MKTTSFGSCTRFRGTRTFGSSSVLVSVLVVILVLSQLHDCMGVDKLSRLHGNDFGEIISLASTKEPEVERSHFGRIISRFSLIPDGVLHTWRESH